MKRVFKDYKDEFIKIQGEETYYLYSKSLIDGVDCYKMQSMKKYAQATNSHGTEWEMFEIFPIDNLLNRIKIKLFGGYYLVGFEHHDLINYYHDESYAIIEYKPTNEIIRIPSFLVFYDSSNIRLHLNRIKEDSLERFISGRMSPLKDYLPEKIKRLKDFFNMNVNPKNLLHEKKIQLLEEILKDQSLRMGISIELIESKENLLGLRIKKP